MKMALVRTALLLLLSIPMSGCNSGPPPEPEQELAPVDESDVYFELPDGWKVVERAPGYVRVRLDEPAVESGAPFVDLELPQYRIYQGSDEDAKYRYEDSVCPGTPPCTIADIPGWDYDTVTFENGVTVYIETGAAGHWPYQPSGGSSVAPASSIFFSKDGYVYKFILGDNVKFHFAALEALTDTIRLARRPRTP